VNHFAALISAYTWVTNRCVVSTELGTFASKSAVVFAARTSSWGLALIDELRDTILDY